MRQVTASLSTAEEQDSRPPDIEEMRTSTALLLGPDGAPDVLPPAGDELDTLTAALRGHMELLIPEVERAAGPRLKSVESYCAAACVGEARRKLSVTPRPGLEARVAHARRLARSLNALCSHWEILHGVRAEADR